MRLCRGEGEGVTLYVSEKPRSLFITAGLGFSGYELTPRRFYRFMHPYIGYGRTFDPKSFGRSNGRRVEPRFPRQAAKIEFDESAA